MEATRALLTRATGVAALALAADQTLKALVRQELALCPARSAAALGGCDRWHVLGPFQLVRVENAGSAFGFAQGWWVWMVVAALGLLLIPLYARRLERAGWAAALAAGLQTGGALGNLADRLLFGRVTDFIVPGGGWVFNLGDVALAAGMVLAVWLFLRARPAAAGTGSPRRATAESRGG